MAFGNKVTDLDQISVGAYGYIVRADTTSILAYDVLGLQAQSTTSDTGTPTETNLELAALMALVNDSECDDLAYSFTPGEVYLFFKISVYPYVDDTRFALIYERNPLKMTSSNSIVDIDDSDMELFMAYAIKHACVLQNEPVPYSIGETIRTKELEIRNGNS